MMRDGTAIGVLALLVQMPAHSLTSKSSLRQPSPTKRPLRSRTCDCLKALKPGPANWLSRWRIYGPRRPPDSAVKLTSEASFSVWIRRSCAVVNPPAT